MERRAGHRRRKRSMGSAPIQNIGAYGSELRDTLVSVTVLDCASGEEQALNNEECGFGYRTSIFKRDPDRYVVLSITLSLRSAGELNLGYKDLAAVFSSKGTPTAAEVREAVLAIRARKFPDLSKEGTAGSFFLNPVVSEEKAAQLAKRFPGIPSFPAEGGRKLSLAFVLDRLGMKGLSKGGARLFENQPLVLVASRGASSHDVLALAEAVVSRVREKCGIDI